MYQLLDFTTSTIIQSSTTDMDTTLTPPWTPIGNIDQISSSILLFFIKFNQKWIWFFKCFSLAVSCSWSTPTNEDNVMQCNDGTYCNGLTDGWTCCNSHGRRRKCPMNYPVMCAKPECAWGDYCCYTKDDCVSKWGGIRPCDKPGKSLVAPKDNMIFRNKK